MRSLPAAVLLALAACCLCGCFSRVQAFPKHTPEQVWTAMTTIAESPEPDDWIVSSNEVWVDPDANRIEIERRMKRWLHRPQAKPLYQTRNFRLRLTLDKTDPPTVRFTSRGFNIPMHAQLESDRFFADLRGLLEGRPQRPAAPSEAPDEIPQEMPARPATSPEGLERIGPEDVGAPGGA